MMAVVENDLVVGPLVLASGVTLISLDFFFEREEWLEVYKSGSETALILNTDYTVSGEGTNAGSVTLTTAANGTDSYSVYLVVPLERSSDMQLRGEFRSEPFNLEMDRLWQAAQRIASLFSRSLRVGKTSPAVPPMVFANTDDTDNRAILFNSDSTALIPGPTADEISDAQTNANLAEAAAVRAEMSAGFDTLSDLLASTSSLTVGGYISAGGSLYEVVSASSTNAHLTTAGGSKLKLHGAAFNYNSDRAELRLTPVIPERDGDPAWYPSTGAPYLNTVLAVDGPGADARVWRSTLVGVSAGSHADNDFDRVEAFGDGAVRFADYLDSVTAIGSLSYQWLGVQGEGSETISETLERTTHEFVEDHHLTNTAWDKYGLETNNPGLRAQLAAVSLATSKADNEDNVGVGRNAGLHMVKGSKNTIVGKNALAHGFYNYDVSAVGFDAFRDGALINRSQALGSWAGYLWSEGTGNTLIGHKAAQNIHKGNFNLIAGNFAANEYHGEVNNLLWIGMGSTATPLLSGSFSDMKLGVNVDRADILGIGMHVRISEVAGGGVNSGANGFVLERGGHNTGITILTDSDRYGQLIFADPDDNNVGGIWYNHSSDAFQIRAANAVRASFNSDGLLLNTLPTSSSGLGTGQVWNDGGTLKVA